MYLDHNASTPPLPQVLSGLAELFSRHGNPSSVHASGRWARRVVEDARESVAALLHGSPQEIVFTSGGTEACNLGIHLAAGLQGAGHAVVSAIEHPAVSAAVDALEQSGWTVSWVFPARNGAISAERLLAEVRKDTALVALMLANNETGVLQPVRDVAANVRKCAPLVRIFCDAVQAVGRMEVQPRQLGVDFLTLSGHKFGGLQGCGALWIRHELQGAVPGPLLVGGPQERERRAGTENLVGIWALGVAARHAAASGIAEWMTLTNVRHSLEQAVLSAVPEAVVNGAEVARIANTASILFPEIPSDVLLMALDMAGYEASAGSACASGSVGPSRVLKAMGLTDAEASSCLRFSLAPGNAPDAGDLDRIAQVLSQVRARRNC